MRKYECRDALVHGDDWEIVEAVDAEMAAEEFAELQEQHTDFSDEFTVIVRLNPGDSKSPVKRFRVNVELVRSYSATEITED